MKGVVILLCCALIAFLGVNAATINAIQEDGFQVVYLDYPAFVTEFHYDWVTNVIYIYGSGAIFRQVNHATQFQAIDNSSLWTYDQPYIDVDLFSHPGTSQLWTIGPSNRDGRGSIGYFTPIAIVGPKVNEAYQGDHRGFTFSAVNVDYRDLNNVLAYFVGWGPDISGSAAVEFLFVRARFSLNNFQNVSWSNTTDTLFLHQNDYHPYWNTFKPSIFHDWSTNKSYVYSPDQRFIWQIGVDPSGISPLRLEGTLNLTSYGWAASTDYHWMNDTLYFGFAGDGTEGGTLIGVNLKTFQVTQKITFAANYSSPRAITGWGNTLYVGFEGGPAVVAIDLIKWKILGFSMLPGHLGNVYAGWDDGNSNWVYFSTYEQHSKIFRIDKRDFCETECYGRMSYCSGGTCKCSSGFELNKDKKICEPTIQVQKEREEGAAVAMGILFALMTIAAGVGWFFVWRAKQAGYQRVM